MFKSRASIYFLKKKCNNNTNSKGLLIEGAKTVSENLIIKLLVLDMLQSIKLYVKITRSKQKYIMIET